MFSLCLFYQIQVHIQSWDFSNPTVQCRHAEGLFRSSSSFIQLIRVWEINIILSQKFAIFIGHFQWNDKFLNFYCTEFLAKFVIFLTRSCFQPSDSFSLNTQKYTHKLGNKSRNKNNKGKKTLHAKASRIALKTYMGNFQ